MRVWAQLARAPRLASGLDVLLICGGELCLQLSDTVTSLLTLEACLGELLLKQRDTLSRCLVRVAKHHSPPLLSKWAYFTSSALLM